MPIYNTIWWKKLFGKKEKVEKVEVLQDIQAITEFLTDVSSDTTALLPDLERLEELQKEYEVGTESIRPDNLKAQAEIIEHILQRYEYFQNDAAINGLRVQRIKDQFLHNADKAGMKDFAKEKSDKWQFRM